jgi:exo-beta-1,3-glucanase (GH17 family)
MHIARLLLCLLLIVLVHGIFDWYSNQAEDAGIDVPSGKLMSLSFAPFHEGFSPLDQTFPLTEHIDADMRMLADKTESIRTYSSSDGFERTPEFARKYGLKMIQGGWIGNGFKHNRQEIAALIASANNNPDVVKRVIVGNEVLLRGDQDIDHLIDYIREVKRAVKQPVSYADVWSMYMKYPQLFKEVDFITIHILPYWEDEPISVENAGEHLEKVVKQVEDEARGIAPGKTILIGESGWPSAGRQRGLAIPGVVNEAKFIRNLIQVANRHGFDYNIVEAFNQPWKSNLEGVVGANWGLFSVDRQEVFPLTGKVLENLHWQKHFFEATALFLLIAGLYFKKLQTISTLRLIWFLFLAQLFGACLINLAHYLWYTSYSPWQRGYAGLIVATNALLGVLLIQRNLNILSHQPGTGLLAGWLRNLYLLFITLALYKTFGLSVNGRYLSFPIEQFLIPVAGIISLTVSLWIEQRRLSWSVDQLTGWNLHTRRDSLVACLLYFAIIALILGETLAFLDGRDFIQAHPGVTAGLPIALSYTLYNKQLLLWLACLFILALPFLANNEHRKSAS